MKWVFTYLKPLRARITLGTFIKIIATLAELMIPFLLSYILEHVINTNDVKKILDEHLETRHLKGGESTRQLFLRKKQVTL